MISRHSVSGMCSMWVNGRVLDAPEVDGVPTVLSQARTPFAGDGEHVFVVWEWDDQAVPPGARYVGTLQLPHATGLLLVFAGSDGG